MSTGPATDDELLALLDTAADAVARALGDRATSDAVAWEPAGTRPGQHRSDLHADAAATEALLAGGVGVLSEESGRHRPEREVTVVVDPLDGSTNAHRGVPWFATSLCAVDRDGPRAAVVVDLPRGRRFRAVRGGGATVDGRPLSRDGDEVPLDSAIVGVSGLPARHPGWAQFRALGALALDLCAIAEGTLDGFVDCSVDAHGSWDYLGGLLVCREAGVVVVDALGRDLVTLDHAARRTPVAGASADLAAELVAARRDR